MSAISFGIRFSMDMWSNRICSRMILRVFRILSISWRICFIPNAGLQGSFVMKSQWRQLPVNGRGFRIWLL